jgi:membrane protease YdiL (CAAX protease family)
MTHTRRNLIIFSLVALGSGYVGAFVNRLNPPANTMESAGVLIWLSSPFLAVLLLRSLGKDGWRDFGLGLNLKKGWVWYLVGFGIPFLATAFALVFGAIFGTLSFSAVPGSGLRAMITLGVASFGAAMVKNIFEEFSWRGYLTPRFEAIGLHPFINSLLTGIIWAGWHIPYYLFFLPAAELARFTGLSVPELIGLAFVTLPLQSLAYGELRLLSGSTWTTWLLHTVANALSATVVTAGWIALQNSLIGNLLSPGNEGIIYSVVMALIGLALYAYRRQRHSPRAQ